MIRLKIKGDGKKLDRFLEKALEVTKLGILDKYGRKGVDILSAATPVDTGKTAASWDYIIERKNGDVSLIWTNSNVNKGVNIALILQYGHGNGNGAYVQGIDYINPALAPVFDDIAENVWKEITAL